MSGPCLGSVAVCTLGTAVRPQDVTHTRTRGCPTPFQANKLFQPSYKDRAPAERLSRNTSSAAIAPFNHCWQPKSSKQSVCLESAFFTEPFGSEDHSFLRLSLPIFKRLDILLFQPLTILSNHYTPRPVASGIVCSFWTTQESALSARGRVCHIEIPAVPLFASPLLPFLSSPNFLPGHQKSSKCVSSCGAQKQFALRKDALFGRVPE